MGGLNIPIMVLFIRMIYVILTGIMVVMVVKAKGGSIIPKNAIIITGILGIIQSLIVGVIISFTLHGKNSLILPLVSLIGSVLFISSTKKMKLAIIGTVIFTLSIPLFLLVF